MGADYTVAEVVVYPVKACKGLSVSSCGISSTGFLFDREWMVVKAEDGRTITMSRAPKLALVQPSLPAAALRGESVPANTALEINAPGMTTLKVPLRGSAQGSIVDVGITSVFAVQGVDQGRQAAEWFTRYLDMPARLVRFDPSTTLQGFPPLFFYSLQFAISLNYIPKISKLFVMLSRECGRNMERWFVSMADFSWFRHFLCDQGKQREKRQAEEAPDGFVTGFQNTGQFMFVSEASLEKVNSYFPKAPFPMNRFRPNIVVRGPPSFEEDKWRQFSIKHMGTQLNFSYAMLRGLCKVPTINMEKPDLENVEPNKTMFSFRSGPHVGLKFEKVKKAYFGAYFVCDSTLPKPYNSKAQVIGVGDNLNVITMKQG